MLPVSGWGGSTQRRKNVGFSDCLKTKRVPVLAHPLRVCTCMPELLTVLNRIARGGAASDSVMVPQSELRSSRALPRHPRIFLALPPGEQALENCGDPRMRPSTHIPQDEHATDALTSFVLELCGAVLDWDIVPPLRLP